MKYQADFVNSWHYYMLNVQVHTYRGTGSDNETGEYNNSIFQSILIEKGIVYEPHYHSRGTPLTTAAQITSMFDGKNAEAWITSKGTLPTITNTQCPLPPQHLTSTT